MTLQENSPKKRPFLAFPDTEAYYPAAAIQQARSTVFRTLSRGEGVSLIFGDAGVGKSLLLRLLADEIELDAPVLRMTGFPFSDRKSFLGQILFELRDDSGGNEHDIRLRLLDYFRRTDYRRFFLLIDDAERLPLFAFDELRALLDLTSGRDTQVRAALFGTSRLEERLNHPKLARFAQRIVARCWLEPFTRQETCGYIERRTEACGTAPFSTDAKKRIHQYADGVPRLINQIADLALWFGPMRGEIDLATVQKSWETLQQIPASEPTAEPAPRSTALSASEPSAPCAASSDYTTSDATVEFGTLDDADSAADFPSRPAVPTVQARIDSAVSAQTPEPAPDPAPSRTDVETTSDTICFSTDLADDEIGTSVQTPLKWDATSLRVDAHGSLTTDERADAEESDFDEPEAEIEEEIQEEEEIEPGMPSEIDSALDRRLRERLLGESNSVPRAETPSRPNFTYKPLSNPDRAPETAADVEPSDRQSGYMEELRLLELEVAQEFELIRKIREMHTGMTSFHLPENETPEERAEIAEPLERNEPPRVDAASPSESETDPSESPRKPFGKAPYRPEKPTHSFLSAFERLYADEARKKDDTPPKR